MFTITLSPQELQALKVFMERVNLSGKESDIFQNIKIKVRTAKEEKIETKQEEKK